uniref:Fibrillar collagen NC1 domain-containing protein n=1 Tax=Eptatretus burgeri TaxID=7764 RepID=A0A8C4QXR3_EPTBU
MDADVDLRKALKAFINSNPALRMDASQDTHAERSEIFRTLHNLHSLIQSIKNPLGSKDNPARICRDLLDCEDKLIDGIYWIDPNLGCMSDALKVTCKFSKGGRTCLQPAAPAKLEFDLSRVQLTFIHLLSSEARQVVKVHCLNTPIWGGRAKPPGSLHLPSPSTPLMDNPPLRFLSWNGREIWGQGSSHPAVLDDCQVSDQVYLAKLSLLAGKL